MRSRWNANKDFKALFTVAAIWNWSAALLFMAMAVLDMPVLNWFLKVIPESFLWYHLFLCLVAVYGLGYYGIGQDVLRNRAIIKMGTIAKTLVFVLLIAGWSNVVITILTAGAGVVDLIFAILFANVLVKT